MTILSVKKKRTKNRLAEQFNGSPSKFLNNNNNNKFALRVKTTGTIIFVHVV